MPKGRNHKPPATQDRLTDPSIEFEAEIRCAACGQHRHQDGFFAKLIRSASPVKSSPSKWCSFAEFLPSPGVRSSPSLGPISCRMLSRFRGPIQAQLPDSMVWRAHTTGSRGFMVLARPRVGFRVKLVRRACARGDLCGRGLSALLPIKDKSPPKKKSL